MVNILLWYEFQLTRLHFRDMPRNNIITFTNPSAGIMPAWPSSAAVGELSATKAALGVSFGWLPSVTFSTHVSSIPLSQQHFARLDSFLQTSNFFYLWIFSI
jgi:hypothetical protein